MSQKFITYLQKTKKKESIIKLNNTSKKFFRKKSINSQQSTELKHYNRQQLPFQSQYIKTVSPHYPTLNLSYIHLDDQTNGKNKFSSLRNSGVRFVTQRQKKQPNYCQELESLKVELDLRTHEMQMLNSELQRMKIKIEDQNRKRRKLEEEKRQLIRQSNQLKTSLHRIQMENKNKANHIDYMTKQIQFLQKVKYNQKIMKEQSFREKYLFEELQKSRENLMKDHSERQRYLEWQLQESNESKFTTEANCKALLLSNSCLIRQVEQLHDGHRKAVISSPEYCKLRDKYKNLIQSYKSLKMQYQPLKAQIGQIYTQKDSLQITISSSSNEE